MYSLKEGILLYKDLIDWDELNFVVSQLKNGKLTTKTLSQRIYRATDNGKTLTLKLALFIHKLEGRNDEG